MEPSNREYAYVSSAVGGSLSQVFLGGNPTSRVVTTHSRGIRGKIRGFSEASRMTFLRKLASINRPVFRAYEGRLISIGLTYPHEYPEDPKLAVQEALKSPPQASYEAVRTFLRLLKDGDTREGSLALPPATLRPSFLRISS